MVSDWKPTTDDDFTKPDVATFVLRACRDSGAGQSEATFYRGEDGSDPMFTVAVAEGPNQAVAVHVDWETREIVTAWEVDGV